MSASMQWWLAKQQQQAMQPQQAQQPQQAEFGSSSPIQAGSDDAMQQVRKSFESRPEQPKPTLMQDIGSSIAHGLSNFGVGTLRADPQLQHMGNAMRTIGEQQEIERARKHNQLGENIKMIEMINKQYEAEQDRKFKEKELKETTRYHTGMLGKKSKEESNNTMVLPDGETIDLSLYANLTSKSQYNRISKAKHSTGQLLHSTQKALSQLDALDKSVEKHKQINPTHPIYGKVAQTGQNLASGIFGSKGATETRNKTRLLNDTLTSLRTSVETGIKGGVPGEQMMKRWEQHGILPHLNDSSETIRQKLKEIEKDLSLMRTSQDISLKYGKDIDVMDLENIFGKQHEIARGEGDEESPEQLAQEVAALQAQVQEAKAKKGIQ